MTTAPLDSERLYDVLIIGGGITGAGVARDAAQRGLATVLAEQHDFASGTSGRSTRLLHGGLRYLAQGRVKLVREASREKRVIQRIAPHLAAPLAFVFPAFRGTSWPLWQLRIGVRLYDLLCGLRGNLGRSHALSPDAVSALLPGLRSDGLTGAVRYYDGFTQDARLVLDTLRSAERHGATLLNYTRVETTEATPRGWRCRLTNAATGKSALLQARCVVSAAGPWGGDLPRNRIALRLTKGVHLVLPRERLPVSDAVVLPEGSRILFVLPWGDRLIAGATDTDYTGAPEDVRPEREDVAYILRVVNGYFAEARLTGADVTAAWAGLRPLIADPRGGPSDISRAHEIMMTAPGWLEMAGGKLTTYRLMAEQAVDEVAQWLRASAKPCRTAREPLIEAGEGRFSGLLPPPVTREAVEHFCRNEWVQHLDDVMLRRAGWHYYRSDAAEVARQVLTWMGELRNWDAARQEAEWDRYAHETGADRPPAACQT